MPIYKADGKKDGLQKYRVVVNYNDGEGSYKQKERTAYGLEAAKEAERSLTASLKESGTKANMTVQQLFDEFIAANPTSI